MNTVSPLTRLGRRMRMAVPGDSWGFALFCLASLIALVQLNRQEFPAHYLLFTKAAELLWQHRSPYMSDLGVGIGNWFYSPGCGLYFFALFSWMPLKIGINSYMLGSLAAFILGARSLSQRFRVCHFFGLFWVLAAYQVWTAIIATKIELFTTGICFLAGSWLAQGARKGWAAFLLTMVLVWKFQLLPTTLLLLTVLAVLDRDWRLVALFFLSTAFWLLAPLLVLPGDFLLQIHREQLLSLSDFSRQAWLDFENIFAFLRAALGWIVSRGTAQVIGAISGFAMFLFAAASAYRAQRSQAGKGREEARLGGVVLALALGASYSTLFSPLGQNNALVLYLPLLFGLFYARSEAPKRTRARRALTGAIALGGSLMAMAYSDLFPKGPRDVFAAIYLKPVVCLICTAILVGFYPSLSAETEPGV